MLSQQIQFNDLDRSLILKKTKDGFVIQTYKIQVVEGVECLSTLFQSFEYGSQVSTHQILEDVESLLSGMWLPISSRKKAMSKVIYFLMQSALHEND